MMEFKKEGYGADVATVLENDQEVLEITRRSDGKFDLTIYNRQDKTGKWTDLSVLLDAAHFIDLGHIADMTICIEPNCPSFRQPPSRSCGCHPRNH